MTNYAINPVQVVGEFLPNVYIDKITLRSDTGYTTKRTNPHIDYPGEGTTSRGDGSLQVELALTIKDILGAGGSSRWFSAGALPNGETLKDYVMVNIVQAYTLDAIKEWSTKVASSDFTYDFNSGELIAGPGASSISLSLTEFGSVPELSRYITEFDKNGNAIKNVSKIILSSDDAWTPGVAGQSIDLPSEPTDLAYFVWTSINLDDLAQHFGFGPAAYPDGSQTTSKINSDVVYRNNKMVKEGYIFLEAVQNGNNLTKTDKLWVGPVHYLRGAGGSDGHYMGGKSHDPTVPRSQQPYLIRQTVPNNKIQDFRIVSRLDKLELNFSTFQNEILQAITKNKRIIDNENMKFSYFTDINLSRDQDNNCRFMFGLDLRKVVRENTPYSKLFAVSQQENPPWLREVMNRVRILSMKIYRKRVAGSSETGTTPYYFPNNGIFDPPSKLRAFDSGLARSQRNIGTPTEPKYVSYDPTEEVIIDGGEIRLADGSLGFIGSGSASMDGVSTMRQIKNIYNNSAQGIYYYTGTDAKMSAKSDGYYQYKVELKIEDGVVEFLNDKRAELLIELKNLKQYYNDGSKTSARFASGTKQAANYDPTTNRFTQAFQNSAMGIAWGRSARMGGVGMKYVQILQIFVDLTGSEKVNIMNTLNLYVSPIAGNPQGCLAVMNLYDNLISFINQAIGVQKERGTNLPKADDAMNATGTSNNVFESDVGSSAQPSMNTFTITHTFSDYYDANLPLNTGFDFLGADYNGFPKIPTETGLRVISNDRWKTSIVSKELTKIFNGINSRIDLPEFLSPGIVPGIVPDNTLRRTDFSYLTPAVVYGGHNVTLPMIGQNMGDPPNISSRDFMNMAANSLAVMANGFADTNTLQETVADFLSYNYNLTAIPVPSPAIRINAPGTLPDGPSATPNWDYVGGSNAQARENRMAFNVFWGLISNGVVNEGNRAGVSLPEGSNQKSIKYYNPQEPNGFYNALDASVLSTESDRAALIKAAMDKLPNPIKALIRYNYENAALTAGRDYGGGALKSQIDDFLKSEPFENPLLSSKARILFETIGEIQYLDGYGQTEYSLNKNDVMEFSAGMPIWKTLDRRAYNDIGGGENSKALLCRIRSWESDVFKIKRHPGNDLPTYEEYFILNAGSAPLASIHSGDEEYTTPPPPPPQSSIPPTYTVTTNWAVKEITTAGDLATPPTTSDTTAGPGTTGGNSGQQSTTSTNPLTGLVRGGGTNGY